MVRLSHFDVVGSPCAVLKMARPVDSVCNRIPAVRLQCSSEKCLQIATARRRQCQTEKDEVRDLELERLAPFPLKQVPAQRGQANRVQRRDSTGTHHTKPSAVCSAESGRVCVYLFRPSPGVKRSQSVTCTALYIYMHGITLADMQPSEKETRLETSQKT